MRVRVIFDRDTLDRNLRTGFGLSFLIDDEILFDTAESGQLLIHNMQRLNVDFNKLEAVVISHDHRDHTGGLWDVLKRKPSLKVYACPHFSAGFKRRVRNLRAGLIENIQPSEVAKDIYATGEIIGRYIGLYIFEQSIVIRAENGISVITGCAHPGIIKILEEVKKSFPKENFYMACGGFHLGGRTERDIELIIEGFKRMGLKKVGPTHCTGKEAIRIFKDKYKQDFIPIKVGQTIEI